MKIYLDFDDTIFDTTTFLERLIEEFISVGIEKEEFYDNYKKIREEVGYFDLDIFLDFLSKNKNFNQEETRKNIDIFFSNCDKFIYDDFFDFVKGIEKGNLFILSFGSPAFQRKKIEGSKIGNFFSETIITSRSKEKDLSEIVKKYQGEKIFFVEDKATQIDRVKSLTPEVITFKMERVGGRYIDTKSKLADYVVKDFYEVKNIIKNKEK